MARLAATYGIVGALDAFPRRLAARALQSKGGQLRRGITRRTGHVVFGRTLLERQSGAEIEQRVDALRDDNLKLMSENGFLRYLRLLDAPEQSSMTRQQVLDQSRLDSRAFDFLVLFDAFEHDAEPFSFRDVILARKYAGLVAGGASWGAIARSVHRSGPVASLTALTLRPEGNKKIYAVDGAARTELDGQRLLPLEPSEDESEEYFAHAETAEASQLFAEAAVLYERCLAIDPGDSVAAFNLANCLRSMQQPGEAAAAYILALKRDPAFVEAWFNYGNLLREEGKIAAARKHLSEAVAIDPDYGDAVYNLATLEYDAGDLGAARRWWTRYLELDQTSEWAKTASRGIAYADLHTRKSAS